MNTVGPVRLSSVTVKVVPLRFVTVIVNEAFDSVTLLETCACRSSVLSLRDSLVMVVFKIWTSWVLMVSFTTNFKDSVSPAFAYAVLLASLTMVRVVMLIGGASCTVRVRVTVGPVLPA